MKTFPIRMSVYAGGESVGRFGALEAPIVSQLTALSHVCSNPIVAAAVQFDRDRGDSFRLVLDPHGRTSPIPLGESNTGCPEEFVGFGRWLDQMVPAEAEVAILSGHALGWLTSLARWAMSSRAMLPNIDASGQADLLTTDELLQALSTLANDRKRIMDVLVFDACLMATVEVMFSLHGAARVIVGTPDELSGAGYNLAGAAKLMISAGGRLSAAALGETIVHSYTPRHPADLCAAVHLDDLDVDAVVDGVRRFGDAVRTRMTGGSTAKEQLRSMFSWASAQLARFGGNGLADISTIVAAAARVPGLDASGLELATRAVNDAVIARRGGAMVQMLLGVSMASPTSDVQWQRDRADYLALPFARATGWGEVLDAVFEPIAAPLKSERSARNAHVHAVLR